ncbi:MAG: ABC transporter transmembrane domain-containing protein [Rhodopseudomonas palustris]|nr:ABC transporter transmembrane domain-containing protein [Rhodopseudomonas palustris]
MYHGWSPSWQKRYGGLDAASKTPVNDRLQLFTEWKDAAKKWVQEKGILDRLDLGKYFRTCGGFGHHCCDHPPSVFSQGTIHFLGVLPFGSGRIPGGEGLKRRPVYSKIIHQSVSFFDNYHSGLLISRVTNDITLVQVAATNKIGELIKESSFPYSSDRCHFLYRSRDVGCPLPCHSSHHRPRGSHQPVHTPCDPYVPDQDRRADQRSQGDNQREPNRQGVFDGGFEVGKFSAKNLNFEGEPPDGFRRILSSPIMEMVGAISLSVVIVYGASRSSRDRPPPELS